MGPSETAFEIAEILLKQEAVVLRPEDPFRFASGILSPIYCDNRLLLSDVRGRKRVVVGLAELIRSKGAEQVAGIATAGIAWGAWVASELDVPFVYVRSVAKDHGKKNLVEGKIEKRPTALVEDLISTGGSVLNGGRELQGAGIPLVGAFGLFSYEFSEAKRAFSEQAIPLFTLVNLDVLLETALRMRTVRQDEVDQVLQWRRDPRGWENRRKA
jgi:orotate phosphoribosyltransferase